MSELLPCPFCGGKPISYEYMGGHIIICRSCGINLTCSRGENFVKKWNTRHYPAEVQQAVERMKPIKPMYLYEGTGKCPVCRDLVNTTEDKNFCWNCGQALDWSE